MKGITITLSDDKKNVLVKLEPLLIESVVEPKMLYHTIMRSDYTGYYMLEKNIADVCDILDQAISANNMSEIQYTVASVKDSEVAFVLSQDKLSATMTITSPYMGSIPTVEQVIELATKQGLVRGISKKRISRLLKQIESASSGSVLTAEIAKGLPPKDGKDSKIEPLIQGALDRVLAPQALEDGSADMRDLGDILCIAENDAIAQRLPPTLGREGFGVDGTRVAANPGKWLAFKLSNNCYEDPSNENIVRSKIAGQPVIQGAKIDVDDTFVSKGVNVATGNVKFNGAVIVNGDVTEKMRITAKGDVTINGFVESAYIESGGNVVITQGASGKLNQSDCTIIAAGSIFIQHGQGLTLNSQYDVIIGKQLAYSDVHCRGNLVVGDIRTPRGKLFASNIFCAKSVTAGHLGAISGSALTIDYTHQFEELFNKSESLSELFDDLAKKNADHEIKVSKIQNRKPDKSFDKKLTLLKKELELERVFLDWLRINKNEYKEKMQNFYTEAKVVATQKIFPGVNIKLQNKNWTAKKETNACTIVFQDKNWEYQP